MTTSGLCRVAGISRQAYHKGIRARKRRACDEEVIIAMVQQQRYIHPRIGARKLVWILRGLDQPIGRDRLLDILRRRDLLVSRKKRFVRTTYRDESLPVYRNLLYEVIPTRPNEVWVSDITYINTDEGDVYLALISDLVSRRIVGWYAADSLTAAGAVQALQRALADLPPECRPIHHSDRGCQYCCHEYVGVLQERGLAISMTEQNHCYENCYAERVNGILKDEYNLDAKFRTRDHARRAIAQAIDTYNRLRPHLSLDMRTPDCVHQHAA